MDNGKKQFWRKWDNANDIEKLELVKDLFNFIGQKLDYPTISLINSYLKDIQEYERGL